MESYYKDFDQEDFKKWYKSQAQEIFEITGIAHWNAHDARFLKILYIQEMRIRELERQVNKGSRIKKWLTAFTKT
jgi:hypothetical protein